MLRQEAGGRRQEEAGGVRRKEEGGRRKEEKESFYKYEMLPNRQIKVSAAGHYPNGLLSD